MEPVKASWTCGSREGRAGAGWRVLGCGTVRDERPRRDERTVVEGVVVRRLGNGAEAAMACDGHGRHPKER